MDPQEAEAVIGRMFIGQALGGQKVETFYAIRLTDGELIYGEFTWMAADHRDDWTVAEESDHDEPTEYEIVEMIVRPIARRTFGEPPADEDDE